MGACLCTGPTARRLARTTSGLEWPVRREGKGYPFAGTDGSRWPSDPRHAPRLPRCRSWISRSVVARTRSGAVVVGAGLTIFMDLSERKARPPRGQRFARETRTDSGHWWKPPRKIVLDSRTPDGVGCGPKILLVGAPSPILKFPNRTRRSTNEWKGQDGSHRPSNRRPGDRFVRRNDGVRARLARSAPPSDGPIYPCPARSHRRNTAGFRAPAPSPACGRRRAPCAGGVGMTATSAGTAAGRGADRPSWPREAEHRAKERCGRPSQATIEVSRRGRPRPKKRFSSARSKDASRASQMRLCLFRGIELDGSRAPRNPCSRKSCFALLPIRETRAAESTGANACSSASTAQNGLRMCVHELATQRGQNTGACHCPAVTFFRSKVVGCCRRTGPPLPPVPAPGPRPTGPAGRAARHAGVSDCASMDEAHGPGQLKAKPFRLAPPRPGL